MVLGRAIRICWLLYRQGRFTSVDEAGCSRSSNVMYRPNRKARIAAADEIRCPVDASASLLR
jgi:hypothetical protein